MRGSVQLTFRYLNPSGSVIAEQAYAEIREDKHPVILIAGGDIARILIARGISTPAHLKEELKAFPIGS
jgi:hypothetical protein